MTEELLFRLIFCAVVQVGEAFYAVGVFALVKRVKAIDGNIAQSVVIYFVNVSFVNKKQLAFGWLS
ncbi:MAG: hypothetical protein MJ089_06120 [Ruminococcus sp.]|nr:hypothetical protein [Ruminococcus sp.]